MLYSYIEALLDYAVESKLIEESDRIFSQNKVIELLRIDEFVESESAQADLPEILKYIDDYAVEKNLIGDSITERDIFDTKLMALFVDRPSNVERKFKELALNDKKAATDYFYDLSCKSNYIRTDRIKRDMKWKTETKYGTLDITINLSKPEKDPKAIAALKNAKSSSYPKCLLCKENQGYEGRLNHPARGNIRLIPLVLNGDNFFMQYSPYVYYNEHCILLNSEHKPMVIDKPTMGKLLDFVDFLPHYFIGSNADLPIVGGSILAHEHFQGGNYRFAMNDAKEIYKFKVKGYDVDCSILYWPLSVIRLHGTDKKVVVDLADHILQSWIDYSDEEVSIYAYTDGERHNTITPIVRKNGDVYEMDLVLRNNYAPSEYPLGLFHPHQEYHHIKKENIGLIEVMGLAVLPARLKTELSMVCDYMLNKIEMNETLEKHKAWMDEMATKYTFTPDNAMDIVKSEVGKIFAGVLEDAGVYKQTEEGILHFKKFVNSL